MQYGDKTEWFQQLEAEGTPVPALDAQPSTDGVEWLWDAWLDLNTCRAIGMDVGPIPWTAVDAYARRHGLTDTEFEELHICVKRLETVQREFRDRQAKRRRKAKK